MRPQEQEKGVIELLIEHEKVIGKLYSIYADKFPAFREFWERLSKEEAQHAEWLGRLSARIRDGSGHFNRDRFSIQAIQHSIQYAEKTVNQAWEAEIGLINALSASLYIEESMLEKKYFEVFEGDSAEIRQVLLMLAEATGEHYRKVRKAWSENKG